jgi:NTE family protein
VKQDVIFLTLSGGGIRATALAASLMNELYKFTVDGTPLTDNIVLISSTSGGSIAAAYVAAHGFDRYQDFRSQLLSRRNTGALLLNALTPRIFYDRSAIFQDFLEDRLQLNKLTFGDLLKKKSGPFVIFNSTDVVTGQLFRFTQRDFDLLCTDLNTIPISVGLTASAALPFALTDVELKNHWNNCPISKPDAMVYATDDASKARRDRYRQDFYHAYDNDDNRVRWRPKYLHLADGGLADNLGARAHTEALGIADLAFLSDNISVGRKREGIRQLLVIEVNARSEKMRATLNESPGSPWFISMAGIVTGIPIDAASALSSASFEAAWEDPLLGGNSVREWSIMKTQIDFDLIPDTDASLRKTVKEIGTGMTLTDTELGSLEKASRLLLSESECFARFIQQSGATIPEGYVLKKDVASATWVPSDCYALGDFRR